jgi:uncharacterized protein
MKTIGQKIIRSMPTKVKAVDKENYTLTMVCSTQETDRMGDIIIQSGWDLEKFKKNPVILNSHRQNDATEVIAKAVAIRIIGKGKKSRMEQDWVFAVNENPKAKIIFDLYAGGFLHASSVGFIINEFGKKENGESDYNILKSNELLEVSAVSVPANAQALAKKKGIDVDLLDEELEELEDEDEDEYMVEDEDEDDDYEELEDAVINDLMNDEDEDDDVIEDEKEVEDVEPEPEPEPKKTYRPNYGKAIKTVNERERETLQRAKSVIDRLLSEKEHESNRKRKINSAIRSLLSIK